MQGFILKITKSVREDVIVRVVTKKHYYTLYRFYGARHNILHAGREIDFEIEYQGVYMPKMRNLLHIPREYEMDLERVYIWQQFCALLDRHLSEPHGHEPKEINPFYYEMLESGVTRLKRQDSKRLAICMYVELLEFEGRLYDSPLCFMCGEPLMESCSIARGFLLAHVACLHNNMVFTTKDILEFYKSKNAINLGMQDCENMYRVLLEGM